MSNQEIHLSKTSLLQLLKGESVKAGKDIIIKGYGLDVAFTYEGRTSIGVKA